MPQEVWRFGLTPGGKEEEEEKEEEEAAFVEGVKPRSASRGEEKEAESPQPLTSSSALMTVGDRK